MQTTTNYGFNIVEGADIVNPLTQLNPNFTNLDIYLSAIGDRTIGGASYSKSGTVHAISRTRITAGVNPSPIFRFTPNADWNAGDKMTIDGGGSLDPKTPDGNVLTDGAFVSGQTVIGAYVAGKITLFVPEKITPAASEVTTTDGDSVQDYIDNTKFKNLETWTPNIGENWETFLARIRDNSTKTIPANFIRCTVDGVSGLIFRQSRRTSATSWQYETDYFTSNSLIKYTMSVGSDSAVLRKYDILNGTIQNLSSDDAQTINIYGLDV